MGFYQCISDFVGGEAISSNINALLCSALPMVRSISFIACGDGENADCVDCRAMAGGEQRKRIDRRVIASLFIYVFQANHELVSAPLQYVHSNFLSTKCSFI
jgi:hypothetical protein